MPKGIKGFTPEAQRMGGLATAAAKRARGEAMFTADARHRAGLTAVGRVRSANRTQRPTLLDIAWAAGIYEGEGWAGHSKRADTQSVVIGQSDRWLLERLVVLFGGRIYVPPEGAKSQSGAPRCATWNISGARARGFLMTIYSFLSPRRKLQARLALGV